MILINQAGSFQFTKKRVDVNKTKIRWLSREHEVHGPFLSVAGLARFLKQQGQGQKAVSSSGSMLMAAMSHAILYLSFRLGTSWMRFWWRYFRVERKSEGESVWLGNWQFFELRWSVDPLDSQFIMVPQCSRSYNKQFWKVFFHVPYKAVVMFSKTKMSANFLRKDMFNRGSSERGPTSPIHSDGDIRQRCLCRGSKTLETMASISISVNIYIYIYYV